MRREGDELNRTPHISGASYYSVGPILLKSSKTSRSGFSSLKAKVERSAINLRHAELYGLQMREHANHMRTHIRRLKRYVEQVRKIY